MTWVRRHCRSHSTRELGDLDGDLFAVSGSGRGSVQADVALSIAPGSAVDVIVSGGGGRTGRLIIVDIAVLAGDGHPGIRGVADQGEVSTGKDGGVGVDGGAIGIIGLIHVRIAAEVVHAGIASVLDGQGLILGGVLVVGVHVRHTGLGLGLMILQIAADIEHGGIGPATVVAQNGDGVAVALDALVGGQLIGVHITLDIGAGVVAGLVILVQAQDLGIDFHMDAAICRDLHSALAQLLEEQVRKYKPELAVVFNEEKAKEFKDNIKDTNTRVLSGMDGLIEAATLENADLIVNSVVGMVGLKPTLAAANAKKDIAFANKETLVTGGKLVCDAVKKNGVKLLPVDSEHSAIFQCLQGMPEKKMLKKLILTASGGPFFGKTVRD